MKLPFLKTEVFLTETRKLFSDWLCMMKFTLNGALRLTVNIGNSQETGEGQI